MPESACLLVLRSAARYSSQPLLGAVDSKSCTILSASMRDHVEEVVCLPAMNFRELLLAKASLFGDFESLEDPFDYPDGMDIG